MTRLLAVCSLLTLTAACGADGEPVKPTANVSIGVTSAGVSAGASVGARKGPLSVNVDLF